ncbi:MAG: hypothetical protein ACYC7D_06170 [Nitrososphaerales archaeon]
MKIRTAILFAFGIILLLSGIVFTLQGLGILGPTNGFMYRSTTWIYNGSISAILGLVLIVLTFFISRMPKEASQPSMTV